MKPNPLRPPIPTEGWDVSVREQAAEVLSGKWAGNVGRFVPFLGPAFIAAVAYIDPGNYATNIESGTRYGYQLLWVVLWSNLIALFAQGLSAKLGIVTGKNLPECIRDLLPHPLLRIAYWLQAELMAIATDLAEFLGAALGFQLLLGIPLSVGALLTGAVSFLILGLRPRGFRYLEVLLTIFVGFIAVCYAFELFWVHPSLSESLHGLLVPSIPSAEAAYLAAGIIGATVMPHAIYLHSALTQRRIPARRLAEKRKLIRLSFLDVSLAMAIAGVINLAMLAVSAAAFAGAPPERGDGITQAYRALSPMLGKLAAGAFALSLLASGLSSSAVGTLSGQVIMQGFVGFAIPIWLRRLVTMAPAILVIALGIDTTKILVASQVLLSFGIGFALVPLLLFTQSSRWMGPLRNSLWTNIAGWLISAAIVGLNAFLLARLLLPPSQ
ncbi:Divalent metal cation transporter MntH [Methylacidimicrobium cyclopophantes]|uniref:Divalent metal cation transporter MntH n=1 Tax=Methylacidimicrobium cyclopophantes TaxID=1041766 RepID=A0A5E6MCT1_9BACT|nr:Nramp family divalent metal transporter [Methylacidimicrobium cyclopophantes]VVM05591.1 Divalent metal cation transporter MntH [Methylacidimicrobium cyclopophantes]